MLPFLGWFATIRQRTENTILAYARDLADFIRFCQAAGLVRPQPCEIRRSHRIIEAYMGWLQSRRRLKATSINRHRYAAQQFFKIPPPRGHHDGRSGGDTFSLKTPKRLPKYLTPAEQDRVLKALARDESPRGVRDYAIVATGLFCGLRAEELATLRLTDVDLESSRLRVNGKGDKEREWAVARDRDPLPAFGLRPFGGPRAAYLAGAWTDVAKVDGGAARTREFENFHGEKVRMLELIGPAAGGVAVREVLTLTRGGQDLVEETTTLIRPVSYWRTDVELAT